MTAIEVDFEVFKALTARRRSESMTENEVLRELLKLSSSKASLPAASRSGAGGAWVVKGVAFPHGTQFRARLKGQQFTGEVQNGALVVNGRRYTSPSAAAASVTGNNVNGWRFWECLMPGSSTWKFMAMLRR